MRMNVRVKKYLVRNNKIVKAYIFIKYSMKIPESVYQGGLREENETRKNKLRLVKPV